MSSPDYHSHYHITEQSLLDVFLSFFPLTDPVVDPLALGVPTSPELVEDEEGVAGRGVVAGGVTAGGVASALVGVAGLSFYNNKMFNCNEV